MMTEEERRVYLIRALQAENPQYHKMEMPKEAQGQRRLLRALMNVRPPWPATTELLAEQDRYLCAERERRGTVSPGELTPSRSHRQIFLWRGDITRLAADAVVNAANSALLGCFIPCHGCIDNAIHSAAGIQLRLACADLMRRQGHEEPAGSAKITPGFNLPGRYVIHTVGPIVTGAPTRAQCGQLACCYRACLTLADQNDLRSIAFCCISTGEFRFPNQAAGEIAVKTVRAYLSQTRSRLNVIFDVFTAQDEAIYRDLLESGGAF